MKEGTNLEDVIRRWKYNGGERKAPAGDGTRSNNLLGGQWEDLTLRK